MGKEQIKYYSNVRSDILSDNKRLLYLTNMPAPYRVEFFNELTRDCNVTVLFEMRTADDRDKRWSSAEKYQFHAIFMKAWYSKGEGAFCPEIIRYIKEYRRDIIVVGGYSTPTGMLSILYMKLHNIPFLLNCDGGMIKEEIPFKRKIKTFFISAASGWLSTGKATNQYLLHYGACEDKIYEYSFTSVRKGDIIEVSEEKKRNLREKLGISEKKMVLFVGRFIPLKGIDVLLRACKNMDDTAVVLVGGNDISSYQEILDVDVLCSVYVMGFQTKDSIKKYYMAADLFVLPTRGDVWGLVVNEAMACGLPIITTTKCVAGQELVQDGWNGYIVEAENERTLKEKIGYLLNHPDIAKQFGKNSLKKIQGYTIEDMEKKHNDIFNKFRFRKI